MHHVLFIAAMIALSASNVSASQRCLPNKIGAPTLKKSYGEVPIVTGMQANGIPIIIFANRETGTWTVIMIGPESSCLQTAGQDLELIMRGDPA